MADLAIGQLEEAESSSKLPPKLLAWGCYPTKLRLNIYSKAHVIGTIASYHQGSKDMEIIMGSQFGRLFELSVARCHNSAKLINSFLCRQLLTVRKYELWFHFATHPLRFSLDEFHQVTGLNCGAFDAADSEAVDDPGSTIWHKLFDTTLGDIMVADVLKMLRNPYLAPWKRVPLALIALVDGVICCSNKWLKLTSKYVEMLCDVEYFLEYPWGRESFLKTLPRLLPPYTREDSLGEICHRLSQQTAAAYGFPLALQLFAFEAVPLLLAKIPNTQSTENFLVNHLACENTIPILSVNDIVEVEEDPDLVVQFMPTPEAKRYMWLDEVTDQHFSGGDTSFAPVRDKKENAGKGVRKVAQPNDQPVHRRNLRPRKPAAVIIEDISSSEDIEPEAPPQPNRCTHEDLKPWMNSSSNSWLVPSRNI
ncbi:PREDICTED: uncharacterized protein LOC106330751 [Brassica oleracea var. oleracea]|uniref:uncharacterized protein LOC106330751 n=1 Tax=Brassica oleracea var. oleracea TaxID=109376 RepID=UPI0006A6F711|nr:PREDICTED: uncharacterized protein LOC106330751 [Brassica oleracea var. oleracea]